jgi:hypothetical protein
MAVIAKNKRKGAGNGVGKYRIEAKPLNISENAPFMDNFEAIWSQNTSPGLPFHLPGTGPKVPGRRDSVLSLALTSNININAILHASRFPRPKPCIRDMG